MPVEKSGQNEFDFEYGDDFGEHIDTFDPDFSKVLVRYNPDDDPELNERQLERLKRLATGCTSNGRKFLFELLVPATDAQLESVGGDTDRYDAELRPELMRRAIEEHAERRHRGRHLEDRGRRRARRRGDARPADAQGRGPRGRRVRAARPRRQRREGRPVAARAAPVQGFVGFAIGRSIWWDALKGFLDGSLEREAAAQQIADNYLRFIEVYEEQPSAVA